MDRLQDKWYLDCKRQYYCIGFPTSLYCLFPTFNFILCIKSMYCGALIP